MQGRNINILTGGAETKHITRFNLVEFCSKLCHIKISKKKLSSCEIILSLLFIGSQQILGIEVLVSKAIVR